MVAFYSQQDQDIYEKNKFMPQSKYLLNAPTFNTPTVEEEKITETFGIPNTNAFTNSGGSGGGGNYSGGNFQQVVNARQNKLNKPIDTSTFIGKAKDFMNPQSAKQIMDDGYQEPRFQPGIIGTIMGKFDNYRNLPQADQAFISQNMGYTGPTIFGENNSGLSKDEFGINTRSMFGNYAEYVDKMNKDSKDMTDKEFEDYVNTFKGLQKRKKISYRQKKIERDNLQEQEKLAKEERDIGIKTLNQRMRDEGVTGSDYDQAANIAGGGGGNTTYKGQTARDATYDDDKNTGTAQSYSQHYAKGGRAGYFFGGRARLQGGGGADMGDPGKAAERAERGYGQTPDTGSQRGNNDYSTMEQNMNHREAIRNNQREQSSTLNNAIDTGSELNYLNNLKNLNLPGLALGFGFNKIRNYLGNKKDEDDKLSALPTNNYMADLNAAQIKQLEGPQKMGKEYGNFSDQDILDNITPFGDEETAPATLKDVQTFYGSNGGRVNFKNGGLAGIL